MWTLLMLLWELLLLLSRKPWCSAVVASRVAFHALL